MRANALFSALAFAALVYTMWLQKDELELQRQELQATRQELERSTKAQKDSGAALRQSVRLAAISALMQTVGRRIRTEDPQLAAREEKLVQDLEHEYERVKAVAYLDQVNSA